MKTKILGGIAIVAIAALVAFNVQVVTSGYSENSLMTLASLESLAQQTTNGEAIVTPLVTGPQLRSPIHCIITKTTNTTNNSTNTSNSSSTNNNDWGAGGKIETKVGIFTGTGYINYNNNSGSTTGTGTGTNTSTSGNTQVVMDFWSQLYHCPSMNKTGCTIYNPCDPRHYF